MKKFSSDPFCFFGEVEDKIERDITSLGFFKTKLMHTLKIILVYWMLRFAITIFIKHPTINKLKDVILRKLISKDRKCGQTVYVWAIMALFKLFKRIKNSFKNLIIFLMELLFSFPDYFLSSHLWVSMVITHINSIRGNGFYM